MTNRERYAAQRLVQARVAYARRPNDQTRLELERAEAKYTAACQHVRPAYLKGERL